MKKMLTVLLVLFAVGSLFASPNTDSGSGVRLSVWSFNDELGTIINNYFRRDNREIQIDYSALGTPEEIERKLDSVLLSGSGVPDVFAMDADYVRKYVESGQLLDLTDIYELNRNRLMRYPVETATYNGRVYALSWQATPGALFYRRSLARKYLGTDDPQVVQTYFTNIDKMMETAALLKTRSADSCMLVSNIEDLFRPFLYARTSPWVVDGRLVIDPAMERYVDICKILIDTRTGSRVGQWGDDWFKGMRGELRNEAGSEVFGYFLPTWGLHYILKTSATNTSGDWAMIQGPIPWRWGGTWLAAYKNTPNPDAARTLISYITTNDTFLERYARDTGDFVSSLTVIQRIRGDFSEPFLGGQNHYAAFNEIVGNINGRLTQGTDQIIESLFQEQANAFLNGQKTKAQALEDFRRQAQSQLGLQ